MNTDAEEQSGDVSHEINGDSMEIQVPIEQTVKLGSVELEPTMTVKGLDVTDDENTESMDNSMEVGENKVVEADTKRLISTETTTSTLTLPDTDDSAAPMPPNAAAHRSDSDNEEDAENMGNPNTQKKSKKKDKKNKKDKKSEKKSKKEKKTKTDETDGKKRKGSDESDSKKSKKKKKISKDADENDVSTSSSAARRMVSVKR